MQRNTLWLEFCRRLPETGAVLLLPLLLLGCKTDGEAEGGTDAPDAAAETGPPASFFPTDLAARTQKMSQPVAPSEAGRDYELAKWEQNPQLALSKAQALKRPLMILFTGMSWNQNSGHLSREVFVSRTFNKFAREHLVLTFMDFPQNITDAPESYERFKDHYEVSGYPTVLLIDPDTKLDVWRKMGYTEGRPVDYFTELRAATLRFRGLPVTDWQAELQEATVPEPEPDDPLQVN